MNTREIRRSFLHDKLIPLILSPSPPIAVNLRDEFRKHIEDQGQGRLRSAELAEEHLKPLCEFVESHLCDWDAQGIPRPLAQADGGNVYLVWLHDRFLYYSGTEKRIDRKFLRNLSLPTIVGWHSVFGSLLHLAEVHRISSNLYL